MQKIMVCIKRVVDYNVRIRVKPDGSGVMLDGVKMSVNPFDEIALEEALRIKERSGAVEIVAVSIGVASGTFTESIDRLMSVADAQLYLAKQSGRNCVRMLMVSPGAHAHAAPAPEISAVACRAA